MGDSMIDETYGQKFNFRKELFKVTSSMAINIYYQNKKTVCK